MTLTNLQCRLAARPSGLPEPSNWRFAEEPAAEPGDGEFLVGVEYISLDPAMRGWMNAGRSYVPPVEIGEVMRAAGIGPRNGLASPGLRGRRGRRTGSSESRATRSPTARATQGGHRRSPGAALPRHARDAAG